MHMSIPSPSKNAMLAVNGKWIAASPDGNVLYLFHPKIHAKIHRFASKIVKIIFSPKAQALYVVDKTWDVFRAQLQHLVRNKYDELSFEFVVNVSFRFSYIYLVPFDKVLYLICDKSISTVRDTSIDMSFDVETTITFVATIRLEIAKANGLVANTTVAHTIVICGDVYGNVYRNSFPNQIEKYDKLSKPFLSKSEPIDNIYVDETHVVVAGKYGTFLVNGIECTLLHPISSIYIENEQIFFMSDGRLYITSALNPSSFHICQCFPAKIVKAMLNYALTSSGSIIQVTEKSISIMDPKPQIIEFSLNKLKSISNECNFLQKQITTTEMKLSNYQFLRTIKINQDILEKIIKMNTILTPNGNVIPFIDITINPEKQFSCQGLTMIIVIKSSENVIETINLAEIKTKSIKFNKEIDVVSPQTLNIDVLLCYEKESVLIESAHFDIFDFSYPIDSDLVNIGTLSPMHSLSSDNYISSLQFQIDGEIPDKLKEPKSYLTPYGEQWTIRISSNTFYISSGTESTLYSIKSAILEKLKIDSSISVSKDDSMMEILQSKGYELIDNLNEKASFEGITKQQIKDFHQKSSEWIETLLKKQNN